MVERVNAKRRPRELGRAGSVHPVMAALPPILIVDDDPDDLFFVRRLIAKATIPNDVVAFENPLGAVDHLERECVNPNRLFIPCAIITDLNMPRQNGVDFIRWIRAHEQLRDIRVIMITDSANPADEARARDAGASDFARKFPTAAALGAMLANLPCATT